MIYGYPYSVYPVVMYVYTLLLREGSIRNHISTKTKRLTGGRVSSYTVTPYNCT